VGAKAFGYCTEAVFHQDATSLLGSSARRGTMSSGEGECIGRKPAVVDEVEGSCALVNLVSSEVILS
jgi:hypothetical protein